MANAAEQMWLESVARYHDELEARRRKEWREYHEAQIQRIEKLAMSLIQEHRAKAEALLQPSVEE